MISVLSWNVVDPLFSGGVMISVLSWNVVDPLFRLWVKPKTITLVVAASPLSIKE
jgi:hypothetical protein